MDYTKHVENIFLLAIVGLASFAVSFLGDMSANMQKLTISVEQLNGRMESVSTQVSFVNETLKDHEQRIRYGESLRHPDRR